MPDFNLVKLFEGLDERKRGFLDMAALRGFLKKMKHAASNSKLIAIVRRFDADGDGRISYQDFEMSMSKTLSYKKKEKPVAKIESTQSVTSPRSASSKVAPKISESGKATNRDLLDQSILSVRSLNNRSLNSTARVENKSAAGGIGVKVLNAPTPKSGGTTNRAAPTFRSVQMKQTSAQRLSAVKSSTSRQ